MFAKYRSFFPVDVYQEKSVARPKIPNKRSEFSFVRNDRKAVQFMAVLGIFNKSIGFFKLARSDFLD
jgi:hypothetical protein